MHVSSVSSVFFCMLQVLHLDLSKVHLDDAVLHDITGTLGMGRSKDEHACDWGMTGDET
jgi:hypothetical protein